MDTSRLVVIIYNFTVYEVVSCEYQKSRLPLWPQHHKVIPSDVPGEPHGPGFAGFKSPLFQFPMIPITSAAVLPLSVVSSRSIQLTQSAGGLSFERITTFDPFYASTFPVP